MKTNKLLPESDATVVELTSRRNKLQALQGPIGAKIRELEKNGNTSAPTEHSNAVNSYLAEFIGEPRPESPRAGAAADLANLYAQRDALPLAIEIIGRRLTMATYDASERHAKVVAPEWQAIAKSFVAAAVRLQAIEAQAYAFLEREHLLTASVGNILKLRGWIAPSYLVLYAEDMIRELEAAAIEAGVMTKSDVERAKKEVA